MSTEEEEEFITTKEYKRLFKHISNKNVRRIKFQPKERPSLPMNNQNSISSSSSAPEATDAPNVVGRSSLSSTNVKDLIQQNEERIQNLTTVTERLKKYAELSHNRKSTADPNIGLVSSSTSEIHCDKRIHPISSSNKSTSLLVVPTMEQFSRKSSLSQQSSSVEITRRRGSTEKSSQPKEPEKRRSSSSSSKPKKPESLKEKRKESKKTGTDSPEDIHNTDSPNSVATQSDSDSDSNSDSDSSSENPPPQEVESKTKSIPKAKPKLPTLKEITLPSPQAKTKLPSINLQGTSSSSEEAKPPAQTPGKLGFALKLDQVRAIQKEESESNPANLLSPRFKSKTPRGNIQQDHLSQSRNYDSTEYLYDRPDLRTNVQFDPPLSEDEKNDVNKCVEKLSSASLVKLVEKLTLLNTGSRVDDIEFFILTYSSYTTPTNLLHLLISRYNGPIAGPPHIQKYYEEKKQIIKNGTMNVLKHWIALRIGDFLDNGNLVSELNKFMPSLNIISLIEFDTMRIIQEKNYISSLRPSSPALNFLSINPDELACQVTWAERRMMVNIRPTEYLKQAWNKQNKQRDAPNLVQTISWFNKMSTWWCTEIVKEESSEGRCRVITNLLLMAQKFRELQNFNGIMEILSTLHNSSISRLKNSWSNVSKQLMEVFEELGKLMSPKSNFKNYREALSKIKPPYIPYLGVFLTDLTFTDDCKPDEVDGMISLDKVRTMGKKIKEIQQFQEVDYSTEIMIENNSLRALILNPEIFSDNDIYRISKLRETGALSNASAPRNSSQLKKYGKYFEKVKVNGTQEVSVEPIHLVERDWNLLMICAQIKTYSENETILQQGIRNTCLYRIKTGNVNRLVKRKDDHFYLAGLINEGGMFGEMSILNDAKTADQIVSNMSGTEVYEFDFNFVMAILNTQANTASRFFRALATTLAQRLRDNNTKLNDPNSKLMSNEEMSRRNRRKSLEQIGNQDMIRSATSDGIRSSSSETNAIEPPRARRKSSSPAIIGNFMSIRGSGNDLIRDNKIVKKSTSQIDETILKEFPCVLYKTVTQHAGKLLITQKYVCYYSKVLNVKEMMEYNSITEIDKGDDNYLTFQCIDKKVVIKIKKIEEAYGLISCIWKFTLKKDTYSEKEKHQPLSSDDWDLILRGSKAVLYQKDEKIVTEGENYQKIFQIESGSCRIEKVSNDGVNTVLGTIKEGETFGEISFLEGEGASASVIADGDVELYIIEGYFINVLFSTQPGFAGRFYHYLCSILASRLAPKS